MTAEIAIINRSAVALATDSAVTLTVRGSEKVYNSADKLFELSDIDAFGIMIYNNLEFMGLSLEVLIKQFRADRGKSHFSSVTEISAAFFDYITSQCTGQTDLQKQHATSILTPVLSDLDAHWRNDVDIEIIDKGRKTDFPGILSTNIELFVARYSSLSDAAGFDTEDVKTKLAEVYSGTFEQVRNAFFGRLPLDDDHKKKIDLLSSLVLIKNLYSDTFTGMVFAGFGEHEQFPSLIAFELDGVICDKLKFRQSADVKTDRTKITGEILPFAQREMVDRFLYGIDPDFESGIETYLQDSIESVCTSVIEAIPRMSKKTKSDLKRSAEAAANAALVSWQTKMVPAIKNNFKQQVQDMIFLMPKQELANLAQELINLTSVKRKFSSGKETVGGPIDVAVISRIDGFVWVQRKHYFSPELNPRYFMRKFGTTKTT